MSRHRDEPQGERIYMYGLDILFMGYVLGVFC